MEISQSLTKEYYETLVKDYDDLSDKVVMENSQLQKAILNAIDFSDQMIQVANHTLQDFSGRFRLIQADIDGLNLSQYGRFDVVISAVTIHNIPHKAKIYLFKNIFDCLDEGGSFINGDFVAGETEIEDVDTKNLYKKFLENNLSGEKLQKWLSHAFEFDMPMKLSEHERFLKNIGFSSFSVIWTHPREAVYVASK